MHTLVRDCRYALRRLRRAPAFTSIVVLTLGLGIGANTAIFSIVHALLLRPLPYPAPEQLVTINHFYPSLDLEAPVSARGFRRYRDDTRSFEAVAVEAGWSANFAGAGEPERLSGGRVSAEWFRVYGIEPALGRTFSPDEDEPGRNHVVVLSDGLWRRLFGADPGILGRTLTLDGEPYEVVGVLPPDFQPFFHRRAELWTPLSLTAEQFTTGNEWLSLSARLKPNVTVDRAAAEMRQLVERLKQDNPGRYPDTFTLTVTTLAERARGDLRPILLVLLGAVGFVLLIACVNVANLLLARGLARLKEVAIRRAMGAGRRHLVRQLTVESIVLGLLGGGLGLLLAFWSTGAIGNLIPAGTLGAGTLAVNGPVLLFTLVISLVAGLLFGLVPALRTARPDLQRTLVEGGRSGGVDRAGLRLRRVLVVAEVALALTLLAGAGLLIKSFARLQGVDPGFDSENLLTFEVALPDASYSSDAAQRTFFDAALDRLGALPGVEAVAATSVLPFGGGWATGSFRIEGYQPAPDEPGPWGDIRVVSPGFARAMGVPLLRGRLLDERYGPEAPRMVVIDEEMVRRFWPDQDPVGQRITFDSPEEGEADWITVVGVVGHTEHEALDAENRVQLYLSYRQVPTGSMSLVVRTAGDPNQWVGSVRQAIRAVDPQQPIANVRTMDELIDESLGQRWLSVLLLAVFAGLAALLAALGIYGVMSHLVTQRTRELGVRMALGAGANDVLRLVLRQGMTLAGAGVLLGVAGALVLTRFMRSQLFGVSASDPLTYVSVAAALTAVAFAATVIPARRAARVPPTEALRYE